MAAKNFAEFPLRAVSSHGIADRRGRSDYAYSRWAHRLGLSRIRRSGISPLPPNSESATIDPLPLFADDANLAWPAKMLRSEKTHSEEAQALSLRY
jgi:hypothetical protein